MIVGKTVLERKRCLASLVSAHLNSVGAEASIVENRVNSKGHTDRVLVLSSIGIIHLTASVNQDPDGGIPTADYQDGGQEFLADKDFVAYGWNTKDKRTMIMIVPVDAVIGKKSLSKSEIRQARIPEYSKTIPHPSK
jgi:hypothetical protein